MDNIIEPNDDFDFSNLSLVNPTGIQGGAYFTKIEYNSKSLYIQTPKSLTKQGFVKNGKKIVVDLMFNNNDERFITWIENLETKCQELIYGKSESWFKDRLELNDIETAFVSPLKVYKSGKYYLVRVNVKMNYVTNIPSIKIYNESEIPLTMNDINENTNIISILEVQGIKFTTRNFQIEMELKQAMVVNTEILFDSCLIKNSNKSKSVKHDPLVFEMLEKEKEKEIMEESLNSFPENIVLDVKTGESIESETLENKENKEDNSIKALEKSTISQSLMNETITDDELNEVDLNIEELDVSNEPLDNDLTEFDLTSNLSSLETMTLKKPNQVYYEIYKAAREKAKKSKREAIQAFLEAKNIKKTYMLDDIYDSDDSDMNIENSDE